MKNDIVNIILAILVTTFIMILIMDHFNYNERNIKITSRMVQMKMAHYDTNENLIYDSDQMRYVMTGK